MKLFTLLAGLVAITSTLACPGQEAAMEKLNQKLAARAKGSGNGGNGGGGGGGAAEDDSGDSNELIGDLLTVGAKTAVAKQIQKIITGSGKPESDEQYGTLKAKNTAACKADTCCIWKHISNDMMKKFGGSSGRCNGFARAAVRLGFHDAGSWNKTSSHGGADGSIILANEGGRGENNGLQDIIGVMQGWYNEYNSYGVGMADLIQMGANVAAVVCPLGPRVRSYVGRIDSNVPAPDGLLPDVHADADSLIKLFEDKTIKAHGLTALVGAHTTSQQQFVEPSRALDPQDSTPGVWDVLFYGQTLGTAKTPKRVFMFPSDVVLSKHPKVAKEWKEFANNGQDHWNEDYAREYIRLSLLGVNNINDLTECTKVLPARRSSFASKDQKVLDKWLTGDQKYKKLGKKIEDAIEVTSSVLADLGLPQVVVRMLSYV